MLRLVPASPENRPSALFMLEEEEVRPAPPAYSSCCLMRVGGVVLTCSALIVVLVHSCAPWPSAPAPLLLLLFTVLARQDTRPVGFLGWLVVVCCCCGGRQRQVGSAHRSRDSISLLAVRYTGADQAG